MLSAQVDAIRNSLSAEQPLAATSKSHRKQIVNSMFDSLINDIRVSALPNASMPRSTLAEEVDALRLKQQSLQRRLDLYLSALARTYATLDAQHTKSCRLLDRSVINETKSESIQTLMNRLRLDASDPTNPFYISTRQEPEAAPNAEPSSFTIPDESKIDQDDVDFEVDDEDEDDEDPDLDDEDVLLIPSAAPSGVNTPVPAEVLSSNTSTAATPQQHNVAASNSSSASTGGAGKDVIVIDDDDDEDGDVVVSLPLDSGGSGGGSSAGMFAFGGFGDASSIGTAGAVGTNGFGNSWLSGINADNLGMGIGVGAAVGRGDANTFAVNAQSKADAGMLTAASDSAFLNQLGMLTGGNNNGTNAAVTMSGPGGGASYISGEGVDLNMFANLLPLDFAFGSDGSDGSGAGNTGYGNLMGGVQPLFPVSKLSGTGQVEKEKEDDVLGEDDF